MYPYRTGDTQDDGRAIFWHYPVYHHSVPASAVRQGPWKLIHFLDDDHVELYHLDKDQGETQDLSLREPQHTRRLKKLLDDWRKDVQADMPIANPDFDPTRREEWGKHPGRERLFSGE